MGNRILNFKRWVTQKLADKYIPADTPERWNWLPTFSMFDPIWNDAFLPGGVIKGDAPVLEKIEEPVPYAYSIPLFSDDYCEWLIDIAEEADKWTVDKKDKYAAWEVELGKVNSGVDAYHKRVVIEDVLNRLFEGLYGWKSEKVARIFLVKYDAESTITEMKTHYDHQSLVSVSINLNSLDEYEGGELSFIRSPEKKIEIPKGRALIFSGNPVMSHKVNPVTEGIRYVLVYWLV
ncbi:MAG: 2OG-Fe(II) oxygenase [Candidatus Thorarchaeota archaeon]